VEVKIGVQNVAREVVLESDQSADEVIEVVEKAFAGGGSLRLADDKGRVVLVPVATVGYVDIGAPEKGRVGFGTV
jgi:hypothetical protein